MSGAMRRTAARHSGPPRVRFRIRSSSMTTSRTQWTQFSIFQWLRVSSSSRSGEISALMMQYRTDRSCLPFRSRTASILPTALRPGQSCRSCSQPISCETVEMRVSMRPCPPSTC